MSRFAEKEHPELDLLNRRPAGIPLTAEASGPSHAPPPASTGRYVLGDEIARGGIGEVYRATDAALSPSSVSGRGLPAVSTRTARMGGRTADAVEGYRVWTTLAGASTLEAGTLTRA